MHTHVSLVPSLAAICFSLAFTKLSCFSFISSKVTRPTCRREGGREGGSEGGRENGSSQFQRMEAGPCLPIVLDLSCSSTTSKEEANLLVTSNLEFVPCSYIQGARDPSFSAMSPAAYLCDFLFEQLKLFLLLGPLLHQSGGAVPFRRGSPVVRHLCQANLRQFDFS